MKRVSFILSFCFLAAGQYVQAQHHHHDTLKNVAIEEVVVSTQVSVNKQLENEQRASKQANIDQILDRIAGVQMVRRGN